jgi:glyoxylase-like metal-dependent hydrolase (beta-lactamase superfamily II)
VHVPQRRWLGRSGTFPKNTGYGFASNWRHPEYAMQDQIKLTDSVIADRPANDESRHDGARALVPDVAYKQLMIVNVMFVGRSGCGDGNWVLIDAGVLGSAKAIKATARSRFGQSGRPAAIILTHGHFDHVGCVETLAAEWDVPVYAHPAEHPFLNGTTSYADPDSSVGGGLLAALSPLFPTSPVNLTGRLRALPVDHSVPHMPGWRWIFTPGHSPGHISLWRESDAVLIAGDAFVTTKQESIYASITQAPEMHGPPAYFTPDWESAKQSVVSLALLTPEIVVTGHGAAMHGPVMRAALNDLAEHFDTLAVPERNR